jgi:predicted AAA+ superfamily ATPase
MFARTMAQKLAALAGQYPVVFLTGPRQSGKTTLARTTLQDFEYISLEEPQNREEVLEDPRGFLRRLEGSVGVILDEVQRTPDLFSYIQGFVDDGRGGPFILTGSQQFLLSDKISQSLAGRAAILELLPLSIAELVSRSARDPQTFLDATGRSEAPPGFELDQILFQGLFPRIHDRVLDPVTWLGGYVRTYVERDVRMISGIGDLDTFSRFLGLCAGRSGSLLNASSLGADAGVTHVTAKKWLSVLRASYIIELVQPHHENFSKRLIRSPKIYFVDTGLLCHLLGIRKAEDIRVHPLRGAIFENFVFGELRKLYLHHGQPPPLYFWRDSRGHEVDFILDLGTRRIPIEAKAGETVAADFLQALDRYVGFSGDPGGVLVYGGNESHARKSHQVRAWWSCT